MKRKRKNYKPEEKVTILKRHLFDKVPISDFCDEYNLHPTVFYRWQKKFFEHGAAAFEKDTARQKNQETDRIKALEQKLQWENEVLSELMEEHLKLKKILRKFDGRLGPHDIRDLVVDFVKYWGWHTEIPVIQFII